MVVSDVSQELQSPLLDEDEDDDDDDIMNEFTNDAIVCARGVCVLADTDVARDELCYIDDDDDDVVTCLPIESVDETTRNVFSLEFLWPRALLLFCSLLYGTNFPLGRIMNDSLPASATTSGRMVLAALALSPFILKLKPELRWNSIIGGCFCALGYLSQSVALIDVPAATVAFLGALVVIITPITNVVLSGIDLSFGKSPQTWLAAMLCIVGVGTLELGGAEGLGDVGFGDLWAILQAVGFGVAFHFTEKMMGKNPDQALPITAVAVGMTSLFGAVWALLDGTGVLHMDGTSDYGAWLFDETYRNQFALPGLFLSGLNANNDQLRNVALAATWTGLITTAANRVGETTGLGKMSSSEAAVLLATEPLWAAVFASFLCNERLGPEDVVGGALIIGACLTSTVKAETLQSLFRMNVNVDGEEEQLLVDVSSSSSEASGGDLL